jgi:hypothetical protein
LELNVISLTDTDTVFKILVQPARRREFKHTLWFNQHEQLEPPFTMVQSFQNGGMSFSLFGQQNPQLVKSLFGVPLCLYTCDPLHLFHPPEK